VELINLLTGQPAAVALAILALYWLNRNTLEFVREKRELIEIIRSERKEWLDEAREVRRELLDIQRASIEAEKAMGHELHTLRSAVTAIGLNVQRLLERVAPHAPGAGSGETPRGVKGGDSNEPF
jgi:hypothetical protein